METTRLPNRICINKWFKSYYVVWKQRIFPRQRDIQLCLNRTMQYGNYISEERNFLFFILFKSYYVVWKLRNEKKYNTFFIGFKSYYVVWKHNVKASTVNKLKRLNRTMQYGNYFCWENYIVGFKCLNRTMQYGNVLSSISNTSSF